MLQKLGTHIAACYERAANCSRRADATTDPEGKAGLLELARSWTHLARSYECVESLERFLLSAHKSQTENGDIMNQSASTQAPTPSNMKCDACGITMRLFGIEPHPTTDDVDLRTYVCPRCDAVKTEAVAAFQNEARTEENAVVAPVDVLGQNNAFDAETTRLLGSIFDAAWEAIAASSDPLAGPQHASLLRELLAKLLIDMVKQGERNPERLIESALGHSVLWSSGREDLLTASQATISAQNPKR
jgi:hypothetical protein